MIRLRWPEELVRLTGAECVWLPPGRLGELAGGLRAAGLGPLGAALLAPRARLALGAEIVDADPDLELPDGAEVALQVPPLRPEDHLTPEACRECLERGARLVDVREAEEFALGRIAGAESRPLSGFPEVIRDLLAGADREPIFVCRSGTRTICALVLYRLWGRDDGKHLAGGLKAWQALYPIEGLPVA
ncbi:MAG: rhodanese-like domain-containing protein [Clostridia bacterium]|nr:rhodanese-like domain-containing protein [Clostridia bacterium]